MDGLLGGANITIEGNLLTIKAIVTPRPSFKSGKTVVLASEPMATIDGMVYDGGPMYGSFTIGYKPS